VPLLFQSPRQRFPSNPRRREQFVAVSTSRSAGPRSADPHGVDLHGEAVFHDVTSLEAKPESIDCVDLHSVLARTRSPRNASSRARNSSAELESPCLSSAIRCWIAFSASSIRSRNCSGRSSSIAARYSSCHRMFVVIVPLNLPQRFQSTCPTKKGLEYCIRKN
jgi:hypothetical protein